MQENAVGIDIGATNTRMLVAGHHGMVQVRTKEIASPSSLVSWVGLNLAALGVRPSSIGVASPGPVDHGLIINPPNLPVAFHNAPLASMLQDALTCPAFLQNDADMAAFGEFHQGAGKGTTNMVYVTWSSGIGAGLILNSHLYMGSHGSAGEIGHTIIDPDGPLCVCGQRGCVEAFAGGHTLQLQTGYSAEELFADANGGITEAVQIINNMAVYMGHALVNLTNLFDPDMIVMGGGIARSWWQVEPLLRDTLNASPFIKHSRQPLLRVAWLGEQAGVTGALEWGRLCEGDYRRLHS